jgi:hypothetical protein
MVFQDSHRRPSETKPSAALDHLAAIFSDLILADQDCFSSEEGYETLLQHIPDSRVVENLREKWVKDPSRSSEDKWEDLKDEVKRYDKGTSQRVCCILPYTHYNVHAFSRLP